MRERYDIIVIGGGHAGTEAAWAAASVLGGDGRVALITMDPAKIGTMSCNPAIGGLAKGQMVREIDALGGIMGRAIDATGIMFKMLNTSKGPAVRGPRAQADKYAYAAEVQRLISTRDNIDVIAATVDDIIVENGAVAGVRVPAGAGIVNVQRDLPEPGDGQPTAPLYPSKPNECDRRDEPRVIRSRAVVLTTGTFMRALMHTGEHKAKGGRVGEGSAEGISGTLRALGFELGRLKTGTPPRIARETIDWDGLDRQQSDAEPIPFSDLSPQMLPQARFPVLPQVECRVTATTSAAHDVIRTNLHRAPMYSGAIDAECGPRYCPSIEDKVMRFADRTSHHVFLEPESLHTNEVYCNGISTSLPQDVQEQIVHALHGCERAKILRWGYAVEYDLVWPHQIDATCMTKRIEGFFLAGQINGTSGYEEAGGQGLVAGLNAARLAMQHQPLRLGRDQAYIGVMLDDLVTKTPREPYRMFSSRAEYRLLLRSDNTDVRLTPLARELGLCCDQRWDAYEQRVRKMADIYTLFNQVLVDGKRLREFVRRPQVMLADVLGHLPGEVDASLVERVMTEARYEGYIVRQSAEIKRQTQADRQSIPAWLDAASISGLRAEAAEALHKFQPQTIGQAGRLAGVSPADLTLIAVTIRRGPQRVA